jgi:zinc transporter, ZIP family
VALLVAIFVSNLPESIGSSIDMKIGGVRPRSIILLWIAVAVACAFSTLGGYAASQVMAEEFEAIVDGFAGALLVMLVGSMIPEATAKAGEEDGARSRARIRRCRRSVCTLLTGAASPTNLDGGAS